MTTPLSRLAQLVVENAATPLPDAVREAARRTLLNVLATAAGAAGEPAVDAVVSAAGGWLPGTARVPGRSERLAPVDAALATGVAAHLDDYDDTHLATVIHPGAVCLSALVALQGHVADRGADDVLRAVAWGVEAQLRLGVSVSPEHYDAGWHITGTCGSVGAAVTTGLLLGLDAPRLAVALGVALEGGIGTREGFGSMTKPFHPGQAAVHGVLAAHAAADGAPDPGDVLLGADGFVARLCRGAFDLDQLLGRPGEHWELLANTFKPYPCGIVSHPAIEAAEALHADLVGHGGVDAVTAVRVVCHPLVAELTGNLDPEDGLQARFSTAHGVTAGLLLGEVGLPGYADDLVRSAAARHLRSVTRLVVDPESSRAAARVEVSTADGAELARAVSHARGSLERPLTDEELLGKVGGLVDAVVEGGAAALEAATRSRGAGYLGRVLAACEPTGAAGRRAVGAEETGPDPDDSSPDHAVARLLAGGGVEVPPQLVEALDGLLDEAEKITDTDAATADPRAQAGAVAAALVRSGRRPVLAAAVGPCVGRGLARPQARRAVVTALTVTLRLSARLGIPGDRLLVLASAAAAAVARPTSARAALAALGLAATQTTGVVGDRTDADARRAAVAVAVADGVAAVDLAAHGFTGPRHPLTGRRGLLSLLAVAQEPSLVEDGMGAEVGQVLGVA